MSIKHSAAMRISDLTLKEDIAAFISGIPAGTRVATDVVVHKADRPGEVTRTVVALVAHWSTPAVGDKG